MPARDVAAGVRLRRAATACCSPTRAETGTSIASIKSSMASMTLPASRSAVEHVVSGWAQRLLRSELARYYLKSDVAAGTYQLMRHDGWITELPVVDEVVGLEFRYFGSAQAAATDWCAARSRARSMDDLRSSATTDRCSLAARGPQGRTAHSQSSMVSTCRGSRRIAPGGLTLVELTSRDADRRTVVPRCALAAIDSMRILLRVRRIHVIATRAIGAGVSSRARWHPLRTRRHGARWRSLRARSGRAVRYHATKHEPRTMNWNDEQVP